MAKLQWTVLVPGANGLINKTCHTLFRHKKLKLSPNISAELFLKSHHIQPEKHYKLVYIHNLDMLLV